jgi:hypothetical protein
MIGCSSINSFIIGMKREINCLFGAKTAVLLLYYRNIGILIRTPSETWVKPLVSPMGFLVDEVVLGQMFFFSSA